MSLADLYSSGWFVLEFKSSVARATSEAHASYACYFHSGNNYGLFSVLEKK